MSIDTDPPASEEQVALVAFAPDVDNEEGLVSTIETYSIVLSPGEKPIPDAVTSFATAVRALHYRATNIEDAAVGEL